MITNITQSKRFQWYMVLAALTCVSAAPSTMEPKTIVAGSSAPEHPQGVVDQSDARVKKNLRTNLDTTESIGENEDRVLIPESIMVPESSAASAIDQEAAAKLVESVETELPDAAVTTGVPAEDPVIAEEVTKSVEKAVSTTSVPRNTQDFTDQHFKDLMGDKIEFYRNRGDLFKNGKYTEWSKSVNEAYKNPAKAAEAKVSTLLTIYGKDSVFSILAAGRKDPQMKAIVFNLEIGLLTKWATDDNRVGDVIRLLTLGKDEKEAVDSPLMRIWINYATKMGEKPLELLSKQFLTHYKDQLVELHRLAEYDVKSQRVATAMVLRQLEHWKSNNIRVIDSFYRLKLNEVDLTELLRSPVLSTWIIYVKMLGPDPYQVLLLAMRNRMGDKKLDSILAAAKADGTNKIILRILQGMQEEHQSLERIKREYSQVKWWEAKQRGGDVFDHLKLSEKGEEMFGTKDWNAWVAYLTFLEKQKHPKDQREISTVIFSVLKKRFSDDDLAKLVATAKTVKVTKDFAEEWERNVWQITGRTADVVFDLLKVKEKGFESPEFKTWALYVIQLNSDRSRDDYVELAYQLHKHYGPDVKRMLEQSRKTAIARTDEATETFVNNMRNGFEKMKSLEKNALEEKELGKRLRTSPPALATDSSKRRKILDESKPPTEN